MLRRVAGSAILFALLWAIAIPAEPRFLLCPFHWLTGLPCPLCGLTRGMFALAKGHWNQAVHFNALSPLGFTMLFSLFWNGAMPGVWQKALWTGGLTAFAAYGVLRLVPA
jgi:hypothetical protein